MENNETKSLSWDSFFNSILKAETTEKVVLAASLLGMISPMFSWFHACTRMPGIYSCKTWNGFQWDNDIYGLFVFLFACAAVATVLLPRLRPTARLPFRSERITLAAGVLLVLIAVFRLLNFRGESSATTAIGPSMGLVFVLASGAGLIAATQLQRLQQLIRSKPFSTSSVSSFWPIGIKGASSQHQGLDSELSELLEDSPEDEIDQTLEE